MTIFRAGRRFVKALIVITKVNQLLGVEMSMEEFFHRPTIRTLAPFLAGKARVHEEQLIPGLLRQVVGSAEQPPGPGKPGAAAEWKKIYKNTWNSPWFYSSRYVGTKEAFLLPAGHGFWGGL